MTGQMATDELTVEAGQTWVRVASRTVSSRAYTPGGNESVGDRIQIEEAPLPQSNAPTQARAVFLTGHRKDEKVQWAISFIQTDFRLDE